MTTAEVVASTQWSTNCIPLSHAEVTVIVFERSHRDRDLSRYGRFMNTV